MKCSPSSGSTAAEIAALRVAKSDLTRTRAARLAHDRAHHCAHRMRYMHTTRTPCARCWIRPRPQARRADRARGARRLRGLRHQQCRRKAWPRTAAEAAQARLRDRLPGGHENRLAADSAQDRGGRRDGRRQVGRGRARTPTTTIVGNARKYDAKAEILGVQVQQMLSGGQEVIIGAVTDPAFGKLVAFGLGGILVEVLKDITFRLAPATKRGCAVDARRHRRGGDPARRARRQARGSRGARRHDRARCRRWSRTFPKSRRWI